MTKKLWQILTLAKMLTPAEKVYVINILSKELLDTEDFDRADVLEKPARRHFPRLPQMIEWGIVHPGEDMVFILGKQEISRALLYSGKEVVFKGKRMAISDWGKAVTGWESVNIYRAVILEREGRTLDEIRREYMEKNSWK